MYICDMVERILKIFIFECSMVKTNICKDQQGQYLSQKCEQKNSARSYHRNTYIKRFCIFTFYIEATSSSQNVLAARAEVCRGYQVQTGLDCFRENFWRAKGR